MQLISKEPLTEDEFNQLHEFLSLPHDKAEPMTLTEIHGFLTAILSAPNLIMPSTWQPILFGGNPDFGSMEQAVSIIGLIGRFNNQISDDLRNNNYFEPLIFNNTSITPYKNASSEEIAKWCRGYLIGSKLDPDWRTDKNAIACLLPFGVLSGEFNLHGEKDNEGNIVTDDKSYKQVMKEKLPLFIKDFFNGFKEHRKKLFQPRPRIYNGNDTYELNLDKIALGGSITFNEPIRNPNKTGRNEQCPCGSGRKYKKCCSGKDKSLH